MMTFTNYIKRIKNCIKKGWCQGDYAIEEKRCLSQAMLDSQSSSYRRNRDYYLFENFVEKITNESIIGFNDKVGRTKQ